MTPRSRAAAMRARVPLLAIVACGGSDAPPPDATGVRYGDESVAQVLDRLVVASAHPTPPAEAVDAQRLQALDERIGKLELIVYDLQHQGIIAADRVTYDPRTTRTDGENVQAALDAIDGRIGKLEDKLGQDMGPPGPGLFQASKGTGTPGKPGPGGPPPGPNKPGGGPAPGADQPNGGPPPGGAGGP